MKKVLLIVSAATLIAGAALTNSAIAQNSDKRAEVSAAIGQTWGDRLDRAALTANQIVAQDDARTAHIKADLLLTPEQEKNWPSFEVALHDIAKSRADRLVAFHAKREQQSESGDVIEYFNIHAKFLNERSADMKKLAEAAQPLYASLDVQQKKRFAKELIDLSRDRGSD